MIAMKDLLHTTAALRRAMGWTMLLALLANPAPAQEVASVYATGLTAPIGLEADARGWLWVAEQGTGNNDGQIAVVTSDGQVHPFLTGVRSLVFDNTPASAYHLTFHDGALWAALGLSTDVAEGYVLRIDTTGFRPGDTPHTAAEAELIDIGNFVLCEGFPETNLYDLAFDANGDLYVVDAGANAVIKRDGATGDLSVLATFETIPNPTPVGPPFIQAVPTSILFAGDRLYVGALTGFPFVEGLARVYEVGLDGTVSVFQDGLTLVTDLTIHPTNGHLAVLQFGQFDFDPPPPGFRPHTGAALLLKDGSPKPLATGLNLPVGMCFDADGNLFITTLPDGAVHRMPAALVTAAEPTPAVPRAFTLHQNYPNPFNPTTTISYTLHEPARVRLTVYNVLGQEIITLVNAVQPSGTQVIAWDGQDRSGTSMGSGIYLYQLRLADQVQSKAMLLMK